MAARAHAPVKAALPIVAAGGAFAASSIIGLVVGVWVAGRSGQPLWVLIGLLVGMGLGAYAAIRLVIRVSH